MEEIRLTNAVFTDDGERLARLALSAAALPGDNALAALVASFGAAEAAARLRAAGDQELKELGVGPAIAARLRQLNPGRLAQMAAALGARIVTPQDEEWPTGLDDLAAPPLALWVKGPLNLRALQGRSVAVVGSRACTAYGAETARELGAGLAASGRVVVSGAAFGIDAAAHRGSLAVDGPTIAVLACSIDRAYPQAHSGLIDAIAETGAVISESSPPQYPRRHLFLLRNRLIATMTAGTVVVEAGFRSGALNTARTADDHGRVVGAVPGPVSSPASAGCHQLIRDGRAVLVTDTAEVVDLVGELSVDACVRSSGESRPHDGLDDRAARVFDAVPVRAPAALDQLVALVGLSTAEVWRALGDLEARGLASRDEMGGWRKTIHARS